MSAGGSGITESATVFVKRMQAHSAYFAWERRNTSETQNFADRALAFHREFFPHESKPTLVYPPPPPSLPPTSTASSSAPAPSASAPSSLAASAPAPSSLAASAPAPSASKPTPPKPLKAQERARARSRSRSRSRSHSRSSSEESHSEKGTKRKRTKRSRSPVTRIVDTIAKINAEGVHLLTDALLRRAAVIDQRTASQSSSASSASSAAAAAAGGATTSAAASAPLLLAVTGKVLHHHGANSLGQVYDRVCERAKMLQTQLPASLSSVHQQPKLVMSFSDPHGVNPITSAEGVCYSSDKDWKVWITECAQLLARTSKSRRKSLNYLARAVARTNFYQEGDSVIGRFTNCEMFGVVTRVKMTRVYFTLTLDVHCKNTGALLYRKGDKRWVTASSTRLVNRSFRPCRRNANNNTADNDEDEEDDDEDDVS